MDNGNNRNENNPTNLYYQYNSMAYSQMQEKKKMSSLKKTLVIAVVACSIFSLLIGLGGGFLASMFYYKTLELNNEPTPTVSSIATGQSELRNSENASIYTASTIEKDYGSVADIYADTVDAIVGIVVEIESSSGWNTFTSTSSGSGVIISEDGYIVTNNHVIANAKKITVYLNDKESYTAQLVGLDVQLDLALLKIDANNLKYMVLGNSDEIVVGEMVLVIGNPLGYLSQSLTVGYISGLEREITLDNEKMVLLQTDAAVNPGNSGGALINTRGELIGIINAKSYGSEIDGIGFAIPINDIKEVLDDIVSFGYVKGRPYLGVGLGEITSQSTLNWYNMMYGMNLTKLGVYVASIEEGSAAQAAGIKEFDCITTFDGVEVLSMTHLKELIDGCTVGQNVDVTIVRGSETLTLDVVIGEEVPITSK
jgi:serine protease Do